MTAPEEESPPVDLSPPARTGNVRTVRYQEHDEAVEALLAAYADVAAGTPVALGKRTSNLFRFPARTGWRLDVSRFDRVLAVDPANRTAEVQGMVTYERLVDATLPYGLMPLVVPQLKTITIGGAVAGLGIESSSFRNGLPHESVLEMEVLTGDGRIVVARPDNEHADLFAAVPNSYGTLGYILRLRIELEPVRPYVRLRHVPFGSADDCVATLARVCADRAYQGEPVDFVDGTVFSAGEQYLTLASFVDSAPSVSDYTGMAIYYRSIQSRREDHLSIHDYLWRWDTDWFWCSRAFGVQQRVVRQLWPKRYRRSDVYRRLVALDRRHQVSARIDRLRGLPQQEAVVQDVEIPVAQTPKFLDVFHRDVGISPIWLCPLRLRADHSWPLYPLDPGELYVNVGFWSTAPLAAGQPGDYHNRLVEDTVSALGRPQVVVLDGALSGRGVLATVQRPRVRRGEGDLRPTWAAAGSVRQGERGGVRRWDGRQHWRRYWPPAGTPRSASACSTAAWPVHRTPTTIIDVRSPAALAYIATARGDLGLARAYITGQIEVEGDLYTALGHLMKVDIQLCRWSNVCGSPRARRGRAAAPAAVAAAGGAPAGTDALARAGPGGHLPPLRRVQPLLRVAARPSMAYTCAVYPTPESTLEEAQFAKHDLVARKLDLRPGMRLLDVGCGWGGMVMHAAREYGVRALGVTLSRRQAEWAQKAIAEAGPDGTGRGAPPRLPRRGRTEFDAVSSIGLTEHIGLKGLRRYFDFLYSRLRPGGRLLNHCITEPTDGESVQKGWFINRYVFPDGDLTGVGRMIGHMQDSGFEVHHEENLRRALRPDDGRLVSQPRRRTGTRRWPRSGTARPGCGGCTWSASGWASSATASSCIRCWACARAATAFPAAARGSADRGGLEGRRLGRGSAGRHRLGRLGVGEGCGLNAMVRLGVGEVWPGRPVNAATMVLRDRDIHRGRDNRTRRSPWDCPGCTAMAAAAIWGVKPTNVSVELLFGAAGLAPAGRPPERCPPPSVAVPPSHWLIGRLLADRAAGGIGGGGRNVGVDDLLAASGSAAASLCPLEVGDGQHWQRRAVDCRRCPRWRRRWPGRAAWFATTPSVKAPQPSGSLLGQRPRRCAPGS